MSDTQPELLAQLRDVHLPEPVSWWPLAPAYWGLLALAFFVLLMVVFWLRRKPQRRGLNLQRAAQYEFDQVYTRWQQDRDTARYLHSLNSTLKRFLLAQAVSSVAKLSGEDWLAALEQLSPLDRWSGSTRHALADGVYQSTCSEIDVGQVHLEVLDWFANLSVQSIQRQAGEVDDD